MAKTKTVSYWTIAANPEQCRQDGQPIRTQDLLILAPKTFKSRFARTRFPAVCASRIDSLCDWLKKQLSPVSQPIKGKQQRMVACFHVFCRA